MREISLREFKHNLSVSHLSEWLPCLIVADGKVVAKVVAPDVSHLETRPVVDGLTVFKAGDYPTGLQGQAVVPYSKQAQASGKWRRGA